MDNNEAMRKSFNHRSQISILERYSGTTLDRNRETIFAGDQLRNYEDLD